MFVLYVHIHVIEVIYYILLIFFAEWQLYSEPFFALVAAWPQLNRMIHNPVILELPQTQEIPRASLQNSSPLSAMVMKSVLGAFSLEPNKRPPIGFSLTFTSKLYFVYPET